MANDHIKYAWQELVLEAFLADQPDLAGKIAFAEQAIAARLKDRAKITPAEYLALDDALRSLRVLLADVRSQRAAETKSASAEPARFEGRNRARGRPGD